MAQLTPLKLEDETIIYIEATENISVEPIDSEDEEELAVSQNDSEEKLESYGDNTVPQRIRQSFETVEGVIKAYTSNTLNALKKVTDANIDKVTLEFGVTVGGETGIPYITKGTVNSNLKIVVECSFPKNDVTE